MSDPPILTSCSFQHVRLSINKGFCKEHLGIIKTDVQNPACAYCVLCDVEFGSLEAYNEYVTSEHLGHIGVVGSEKAMGTMKSQARRQAPTYKATLA